MPYNYDELTQAYFAQVYQGSWAPQRQQREHHSLQQDGICCIYGELHYYSVQKIMKKLKITQADTVLDLGSGLGKFALQIFMQSSVSKVIGIEAMFELYQKSVQVVEQFKSEFSFFWQTDRQLLLYNENFLDSNWQGASIVYSCSTCFTQDLLNAIGHKINNTASVSQVLSLRPLPTLQMRLKDIFSVECSWDTALCYHYAVGE